MRHRSSILQSVQPGAAAAKAKGSQPAERAVFHDAAAAAGYVEVPEAEERELVGSDWEQCEDGSSSAVVAGVAADIVPHAAAAEACAGAPGLRCAGRTWRPEWDGEYRIHRQELSGFCLKPRSWSGCFAETGSRSAGKVCRAEVLPPAAGEPGTEAAWSEGSSWQRQGCCAR